MKQGDKLPKDVNVTGFETDNLRKKLDINMPVWDNLIAACGY